MSDLYNAINQVTVPLTGVKQGKARVYKECKMSLIGLGNLSLNFIDLDTGNYNYSKLQELGLANQVFSVKPGPATEMKLFRTDNMTGDSYVITPNQGKFCLPDSWKGQVKSFIINNATVEKFDATNPLSLLLNVILVLLILFIIYKILV